MSLRWRFASEVVIPGVEASEERLLSQEEHGMRWRWAVGVVLVPVIALTEGCRTYATVTSALLCQNTGGNYVNRVCMPGSPRKAEDMCAGFGGSYSAKDDECKIPPRTP